MSYATQDALYRLGLPEKALRGVPQPTINNALEAASRLADSYLRARYTLPLTAWDEALTWAVAAIAAYDLMAVRGYDPARGADEVLRLRYEDAIRWLERVAAGVVSPEMQDSTPDVREGAFFAVTSPRRWP
jgi:phage gp36-like protein